MHFVWSCASMTKLLFHGQCSESGLHSLPSRSSWCPWLSIDKTWLFWTTNPPILVNIVCERPLGRIWWKCTQWILIFHASKVLFTTLLELDVVKWNHKLLQNHRIADQKVWKFNYHTYLVFFLTYFCNRSICILQWLRLWSIQNTPFQNAKRWLGKIHLKFCF